MNTQMYTRCTHTEEHTQMSMHTDEHMGEHTWMYRQVNTHMMNTQMYTRICTQMNTHG